MFFESVGVGRLLVLAAVVVVWAVCGMACCEGDSCDGCAAAAVGTFTAAGRDDDDDDDDDDPYR